MAGKSKVVSTSRPKAVDGGSGHMFPKMSTGTQKPGQSASMGRGGGKFASGGSGANNKMFPKSISKPVVSGRSPVQGGKK